MKAVKARRTISSGLILAAFCSNNVLADTIKIGVIGALTGGGAPWGIAAFQGTKIAADEVNAAGGLDVAGKRWQVQVIAYDDQYRAADAVAAYSRLVNQDGAKYVILMSSASTLAVKQSVESDKVLALTSSYSAKAIDQDSRYMYRLFSVGSDYVPSLIDWLSKNYKARRVYLINPNDETGWDQDRLTNTVFRRDGFDVLGHELYERNQKDFQSLFTKILASKPELVDLGSTPPATAGLMIRQGRELGYKGLFLKTGRGGPKEIVAGSGKEAAEGMISILYADPLNPGYTQVASKYRTAVGQDPNEIVVCYYDATRVLFKAIQKGGKVDDTSAVTAAMPLVLPMKSAQGEPITLGGKTATGVNQQFMTVMYIGVVKDGKPVVVGTAR